MDTDMQSIELAKSSTRRRRLLGLSAKSAAAFAGLALAGGAASVKADDDQLMAGSWMVAATPAGMQAGPPRLLVSLTADGVALRTAPLQQAAPPALGSDK